MKTAIITGISGQDGAYLSELLLKKNYRIIGTSRTPDKESTFWRLKKLNVFDKIRIVSSKIKCKELIKEYQPDEIYHLSGQSSVGDSFNKPFVTINSSGFLSLQWLESIRKSEKNIKFYNASSSEIFGQINEYSKDELSNYHPRSPYAVAKLFAHFSTINYREAYNLFVCNGILFNHESPLRGSCFVTQKVVKSVAKIYRGELNCFEIGNLSSARDWGHAKDYVYGMHLILQAKKPDDFVLATGKLSTVRDLIINAFKVVDIDIEWSGKGINEKGISRKTGKQVVKVNKDFYRPAELEQSLGNSLKARNILGWEPVTKFESIVEEMVLAHLS